MTIPEILAKQYTKEELSVCHDILRTIKLYGSQPHCTERTDDSLAIRLLVISAKVRALPK